ncbi:MAG: hypothetical protein ACI31A_07385 [Candidatus Limisoma sp.]
MKRLLILVVSLFLGVELTLADKIITRDADIIDCKVTSITDGSIKYSLEGEEFERAISKSNVFKIKFDNGEEETFAVATGNVAQSSASTTTQAATSATTSGAMSPEVLKAAEFHLPDLSQMPQTSKLYQAGDWFSENGLEGVVICTTPDHQHGIIICPRVIKAGAKQYPFFKGPTDFPLGMSNADSGYYNLLAYKEFINTHPEYGADMFPLMNKSKDLFDKGWYVPSAKELLYFMRLRNQKILYKGSNPDFKGKTTTWGKIYNKVSKQHGGHTYNSEILLSSTEIYSKGGASVTFDKFYGDPSTPQYCVYKVEYKIEDYFLIPARRDYLSYFVYFFHYF